MKTFFLTGSSIVAILFTCALPTTGSYASTNSSSNKKYNKNLVKKQNSNNKAESYFKGVYLGGGLGLQLTKISMDSTIQVSIPAATSVIVSSNPNINSPSYTAKLFLGYSFLFAQKYYLGFEGRVGFENIKATNNIVYREKNSSFLLQRTEKVSLTNHFSLLIEPGFLAPSNTLIYGALGTTLAQISFKTNASYSQNLGAVLSANTSTNQNKYHFGLLVGLGLERYLTEHLSAQLEYDFIYFGNVVNNKDVSTNINNAPANSTFSANTLYTKVQMNTFVLGLTYHFA